MHTLDNPKTLHLRRGQHAQLRAPQDGSLRVENPEGQGTLLIRWEGGRAQVQLETADLHVVAANEVSFHCDRFKVQADRELELQSQGTWRASAAQDMDLRAQELSLRATLGDLVLRANDFVRALGEKILLNTDLDPESSKRQARQYLARLLGYDSSPPPRASKGPEE